MKKVLMIAYFYPPIGGVAVQRVFEFSVHLKRLGWDPIVLTVENGFYRIQDRSLLTIIEREGIQVVRVPTWERFFFKHKLSVPTEDDPNSNQKKPFLTKLKHIVKNLLLFPDQQILWFFNAVRAGKRILAEHPCDVIYATFPLPTNLLVANVLKKRFNIPLVFDFRDLWTTDARYSKNWFYKLAEQKMEKKLLRQADAVISVSDPVIMRLKKNISRANFSVIENGYSCLTSIPRIPYKKGDKLKIGYFGTFYANQSPKNFIIGLHQFFIQHGAAKKDIEFHIYGQHEIEKVDLILDLSEKLDLKQNIFLHSFLDYSSFLNTIMTFDILLLIIAKSHMSDGIFTGKIFEYIRAERPILALVPDGVAKVLIQKTATGWCIDPDNIFDLVHQLELVYNSWKMNLLNISPNKEEIEKFDRKYLTKRLIDVFETAIQDQKK